MTGSSARIRPLSNPRLHAELTHESRCVEVQPSLAEPIAVDVVDGDHRQLRLLVRGRKAKLRADVFPLKRKLGLTLVESPSTPSGVTIQTYLPAGRATFGNAGE